MQYLVNGIINGSVYGLLGVSFGLVLAVTGRFHFARAAAYAIAGFFTAWLVNHDGVPAVPAILIAIFAAVIFNCLTEVLIYRAIAARMGAQALVGIFVASFGLTIAVSNLMVWVTGVANGPETFTWISTRTLHVGGVTFIYLDVVVVASVWACGIGTWALLRGSSLGRRIRAVESNPGMSEVVGINIERTYLVVFAISALLGGVAAVLSAMKYAATPSMGLTPIFYAFVVAFAAGLGRSPLRIMIVGTAVGLVEGIAARVLSVPWQPIVVFGILLIYLILKAAYSWRPNLFQLRRRVRGPARAGTSNRV
jgi:branched-chain amino acid transport system permease protein